MLNSIQSMSFVIFAFFFGIAAAVHAEEPRKIAFVDTTV